MSEIWYASDLHLFHENMFKTFTITCPTCNGLKVSTHTDGHSYCNECGGTGKIPARPFSSIQEMHECMIEAHNARVKTTDHYWNLGDVCMLRGNLAQGRIMQEEMSKFNGHKRLVLGNHDQLNILSYGGVFEKVRGSHRMDNLLFTHIPIHRSCIPRGCVNVHGHIHTQPSPAGPYINISMEAINYAPVSLGWLKEQAEILLRKEPPNEVEET